MVPVGQDEHVVLVQVPVARRLPQLLADHAGSSYLGEAPLESDLAGPVFQRTPQRHAAGVPEGGGRRLRVKGEQVELASQAAVVALLGLLEAPQVTVELCLRLPDRAVDALQHRTLLVPAPVRAGGVQQLERAKVAGRVEVRATAQVAELPVAVEADDGRLLLGQLGDDLHLVVLSLGAHLAECVGAVELAPLERQVGRDLPPHPSLDRLEVVGGQGAREVEVVVEPVLDCGTDAQLGPREELEDRRRHDVRGGVAHRVKTVVGTGIEHLGRRRSDLVPVHGHCSISPVSVRR